MEGLASQFLERLSGVTENTAGATLAKIEVGQRVRLLSGGPVMVVENVVGQRVGVSWTDPTGERQEEEYDRAMLAVVDAGER